MKTINLIMSVNLIIILIGLLIMLTQQKFLKKWTNNFNSYLLLYINITQIAYYYYIESYYWALFPMAVMICHLFDSYRTLKVLSELQEEENKMLRELLNCRESEKNERNR